MPGPEIPGTDHVCRLCGGSKCDDDGQPSGAAFMLRAAEPYLSTNWLESTGASSRAGQIAIVRRHLTGKGVTLPASGRLAVLHLQTVIDPRAAVRKCQPYSSIIGLAATAIPTVKGLS